MLKTKLTIGVKDYASTLSNTCVYDHECRVKLKVSFELEGDFLNAAYSDNIRHTVDYEQLCKFINARFTKPEDINLNNLKLAIKDFSPLINTGFVTLEVSCAHTYSKDQGLL